MYSNENANRFGQVALASSTCRAFLLSRGPPHVADPHRPQRYKVVANFDAVTFAYATEVISATLLRISCAIDTNSPALLKAVIGKFSKRVWVYGRTYDDLTQPSHYGIGSFLLLIVHCLSVLPFLI